MRYLYTLVLLAVATATNAQIKNVTDIKPGAQSSNPFWLTVYKGFLTYLADSSGSGVELYRTDNSDMTERTQAINTGNGGPVVSHLHRMTEVGGTLYFAHRKSSGGTDELFYWNGSTAIKPEALAGVTGYNFLQPAFVTSYWSTNLCMLRGYNYTTQSAPELVYVDLSIIPQPYVILSGEQYHSLVSYKNDIYVSAGSGATNGNIYVVYPFQTPNYAPLFGSNTSYYEPKCMKVLGDNLFFTSLSAGPAGRYDLYFWDGVATHKVTNDTLGPAMTVRYDLFDNCGIMKGDVYFTAVDSGESFPKLYKYTYDKVNSTAAMSQVFQFDMTTARIGNFLAIGDTLYFTAGDTLHGQELWMYTGSGQPSMVADLNPGVTGSDPIELTEYQSNLYFVATEPSKGTEVFRLPGGTGIPVRDKEVLSARVYPNPAQGDIYFELDIPRPTGIVIRITDMMGKLVCEQTYDAGTATPVVSLKNFAAGEYMYQVMKDANTVLAAGKFSKL